MLLVSAHQLVNAFAALERVSAVSEEWEADRLDEPLDEETRGYARLHLREVADITGGLELKATLRATWRTIGRLDKPTMTNRELGACNKDIFSRLKDELEGTDFIYVEARWSAYLNAGKAPFGDQVFTAFPSAIADVEEAGLCLAYGVPTACVFHLMRVMEAGLKALAHPIGISYAPSWEAYLSQIQSKMAAKHASKLPAWKRREPLFRELMGDLQVVKMAWRNPTMHIVRHYSADEAEEIYKAVRGFMKRLAAGGLKDRRRP